MKTRESDTQAYKLKTSIRNLILLSEHMCCRPGSYLCKMISVYHMATKNIFIFGRVEKPINDNIKDA